MEANKQGKIRSYPYPTILTKLFLFLYLAGARLGEALHSDRIIAYEKVHKGRRIAYIEKINEKHFINPSFKCLECGVELPSRSKMKAHLEDYHRGSSRGFKVLGERGKSVANLPLEGYDAKRWDDIMRGVQDERGLGKKFAKLGGYQAAANLSQVLKHNFRANMTDDKNIYEDHGITPHNLRHLRAYNMLINKGYPPELIQAYMGWARKDMLEHYVYIQKQLKTAGQLEMLDRLEAKA